MSKTEDIETILARHKEWLESGGSKGEKANFSGKSPGPIDLSGADLRYANFDNANLEQADFSLTDLQWGSFAGARLAGANLRSAKLISADLRNADLSHADLREATLIDADLSEARLIRADLRRASFLGAKLSRAHLQEANLEDAYLATAELRYADLTEAKLPRACLRNALLEKAVLRDTALAGTDFENAELRGADLRGARYLSIEALKRGINWREAKRDGIAVSVGGLGLSLRFIAVLALIAGLASVLAFAWIASLELPRGHPREQRAEAPGAPAEAKPGGERTPAADESAAATQRPAAGVTAPLPEEEPPAAGVTAPLPEEAPPAGEPPASWTPTEEAGAGASAADEAPAASEPEPDRPEPEATVELGPPPTAPEELAPAAPGSGPVRRPPVAAETAEAPPDDGSAPAPWQAPTGAAAGSAARPLADDEIEPVSGRFIATQDTNVRSGPSTGTSPVGVVPKGAEVRVLGRHKQLRWYKVALADGRMGYIYVPLLRRVEQRQSASDVVPVATRPAGAPPDGAGAAPQLAARQEDMVPAPRATAEPAQRAPAGARSAALGPGGEAIDAVLDRLRSTGSCIRCDLQGMDLRGLDLSGLDLSGSDLRGSDLRGADLSRTSLFSSNLIGADLSGAKLIQATLNGANLSGADLRHADLSGARLSAARGLTPAQLDESCGDDRTRLPQGLTIPDC